MGRAFLDFAVAVHVRKLSSLVGHLAILHSLLLTLSFRRCTDLVAILSFFELIWSSHLEHDISALAMSVIDSGHAHFNNMVPTATVVADVPTNEPQLFPDGHWKGPDVGLVALQSILAFVATAAVTLRMYARISLRKKVALDDICIVIGLCFAVARAVVASLSTQSGWASRKGPDAAWQVPYYLHYFERRLFYAISAFFIRSGVLLYYLRLFPAALRRLRWCSWALLAVSFAQCLQLSVLLAVYCNDITDLYKNHFETYSNPHCSNAYAFTYSGAIGDAAIDFFIYILPLPYVWNLRKLKLEQRIGLVFVFGIGIVACIFALLQIPFIIMNYRYHPETGQSWFGTQVSTFIAIELCLGLTAASLPDLRGLMARIKPGFMAAVRHRDESSSGQMTASQERERESRRISEMNAPAHGMSIGGGVRMGGEYGVSAKIKKPDWMRSMTGSLWEDTHVGESRIDGSRETSRSRGGAAGSARDVERGEKEDLPHAGRPSIVPELSEESSRSSQPKLKIGEITTMTDMEKSCSSKSDNGHS